jgi:molecular chaperone GrpE (heat shock protein)
MTSERDQLTRDRDALADPNKVQQATIEQFTKEKVNLSAKAAYDVGLLVILSKEMRGMPLNDSDKQVMTEIVDKDALTVAADIEKNVGEGVNIIKKLAEDNSKLTDRYNSLLADYRDYVNRAEIRQQVRLANALAIYSAMPKYTPPQQINRM